MTGASALVAALVLSIAVITPAWAQGGQGATAREAPARVAAADSLFTAGRSALNQGEYTRAVELFRAVQAEQPPSPRLSEALYWEAFALYRLGGTAQLRSALAQLERQRAEFPDAATAADARALISRIQGQLAQLGDAAAAAAVGEAAAAAARPVEAIAPVVVVAPRPSPAQSREAIDTQREIASIQRELAGVQRQEASIQREVAAVHRDMAAVHRNMASAVRGVAWGARETLPEGCSREDAEIRTAALNALLMVDTERAFPVLRQVLERRDPCSTPLRRTAVFLVAQKATPETERLLLETARTDPDLQVRKNAVFHLSQVGSERAVEVLEEILRTPADSALQEQALFALSKHGNERARRMLRTYAARGDIPTRLRGTAIFWVGQDGSPESRTFLRQLYEELRDEQLKGRVLFSVAQSGDAETTRWLLGVALDTAEAKQTRTTALHHAGTRDNLAIGDLVALYGQLPDRELKGQLFFTLAQRKEPEAVDKLIEVARAEPDAALRKQAIYWLSQSQDPRALGVLLEIIGGT
jgi:HEAT repeat protein/outer membrane protein assembly factor BamD (BamD/ComL family)